MNLDIFNDYSGTVGIQDVKDGEIFSKENDVSIIKSSSLMIDKRFIKMVRSKIG